MKGGTEGAEDIDMMSEALELSTVPSRSLSAAACFAGYSPAPRVYLYFDFFSFPFFFSVGPWRGF